jgi:hypothetical protein
VGLLAAALGCWKATVPPMLEANARSVVALLRQAADRAGRAAVGKPVADSPPGRPVADVLAHKSTASANLVLLATLVREHGLRSTQVQYRESHERHAGVESIHIVLPLAGRYVAIRRCLEAVLREMPHASVDHVAFQRETIDAGEVSARVGLTLWFRADEATTKTVAGSAS